ncbi:MAG: hypothetical protein A4E55_01868 [Pelotomaculum sp. PtaU1.Bin035]|nr:MAG: hypothetical protein A4E52_00050 [Pelotomaculum sp. PtaB.Bin013]OPY57009.1 MAG: hypothetical protein A4E55_01868 [Pelotomaculum sp. PtaU1.Bin035]
MMTNTGRRINLSDGYYIRKQIGRRQMSKVSASFLFTFAEPNIARYMTEVVAKIEFVLLQYKKLMLK